MPELQIPAKLVPILTTPKRIKVAVGGRGGGKSITFADAFLKYLSDGEKLCCAREFQNSIEESVHSLLKDRAGALQVPGVSWDSSKMYSQAGGEIFYRGLARNPESIKSMHGVKRIWVEEAQTISEKSIDLLEPTIREGESELWFSLNRGSSKDPISQRYLKPYEKEVRKQGFYEDDNILIVQINWDENPFFPKVLNNTRLRDKEILPRAKYDHIWGGEYSDTVEDAIIEADWFDACIDAHIKLGFEPLGQEIVSYDPADVGDDKAVCYRHGPVVLDVKAFSHGMIDTATDWACEYANEIKPDIFIWDGDGMGTGLKRQIDQALSNKKIRLEMFRGSMSADRPDQIYERTDGEIRQSKTNKETFLNQRAQHYWMLRDRVFKTYQAVKKNKYCNPDEMISFSSKIEEMDQLRAEMCRIPRKWNGSGRIQLLTKAEMKKIEIDSPNMADAVMMSMKAIKDEDEFMKPLDIKVSIA